MKNNDKNSTLLIVCGFECQQDCIFCSTAYLHDNKAKTTKELFSAIRKGRKNGYQNIEFSGGEVTIRNDIFELIKFAKDSGYGEVGVVSNGMRFCDYDFCNKIIDSGLTYALISIHGHNKVSQEKISRTVGSFSKTVAGIKNLVKLGLPVAASTAINKLNCLKLGELGIFLKDLGIDHWMISDLIPDGYAIENYKSISVPYSDISLQFNRLDDVFNKFKRVQFWYFPVCVFPEHFHDNPKILIVDSQLRKSKIRQTGYKPLNVRLSKRNNKFYDVKRIFLDGICGNCRFNGGCGGVFKEYLKIHPAPKPRFYEK